METLDKEHHMDNDYRSSKAGGFRGLAGQYAESGPAISERRAVEKKNPSSSALIVGAKTLAGIGIGLVTVIGGAAIIGVAAETVLIPSLLLKLAGGIAGGGVGMAKGIKDTSK